MTSHMKDFLADLVTEPNWAPTVLQRLFSVPTGHWISVEALCRTPDNAEHIHHIHVPESVGGIMATRLPYPDNKTDDNIIIFYNNIDMSIICSIVTNAYVRKTINGN